VYAFLALQHAVSNRLLDIVNKWYKFGAVDNLTSWHIKIYPSELNLRIKYTPDCPGADKAGSTWFKRKLKINLENMLQTMQRLKTKDYI
jgi:hypothetical protein